MISRSKNRFQSRNPLLPVPPGVPQRHQPQPPRSKYSWKKPPAPTPMLTNHQQVPPLPSVCPDLKFSLMKIATRTSTLSPLSLPRKRPNLTSMPTKILMKPPPLCRLRNPPAFRKCRQKPRNSTSTRTIRQHRQNPRRKMPSPRRQKPRNLTSIRMMKLESLKLKRVPLLDNSPVLRDRGVMVSILELFPSTLCMIR
uniref:Uncharacterized protein n=1 Tax=Cacopsylla melanoneura TaxID=428564 RepID=A0A8D8LJV9_9HEMI